MKTVETRLKEVKEWVSCPETGSAHYGKWGTLPRDIRLFLYQLTSDALRLIEDMDTRIKKYYSNRECIVVSNEEMDFLKKHAIGLGITINGEEK